MLVAAIAALASVMQWTDLSSSPLAGAEYLVRDPLRRALARSEPETRVTVIDIDESSITALGPWPWPRARIADLLDTLVTRYRARAVGMDIVFPSPADAPGDARIAALADFAPVVLAQALDFVDRTVPLQIGQPVFDAPAVLNIEAARASGYMANHDGMRSARCVGNIGLQPDADGRIRRVPLVANWRGHASALLPLAMLACGQQRGGGLDPLPRIAATELAAGQWEVPYARDWSAYTVIPARAILDGSAPADLLQNRWVLVGSSALGLNDRAATPLAASAAGVMVHAAALSALLDRAEGSAATLPVDGRWVATLWTLVTLAAAAWALGRWRAWWLLPAAVVVVVAWLGVAAWLLGHSAAFSVSAPLLAYLLMLLAISVELWMVQREQGQILRSFATYVAPGVLHELLRRGLDDPMIPQHGEITVISADMQDYTGLTNRSSLQDAAALTREFLQCLTGPILEFGGTLDKYTGDGLVAFWGAPIPDKQHAARALDAAKAMVGNVRDWNEKRVARGLVPARVRIGVESGPVLVGDLGTHFRRTYTAVGDCINAASKLQSVAKTMAFDLVVGPVAAGLAGDTGLAEIGRVQLPGHQQASVLWSFPSLRNSLPQPRFAQDPVPGTS